MAMFLPSISGPRLRFDDDLKVPYQVCRRLQLIVYSLLLNFSVPFSSTMYTSYISHAVSFNFKFAIEFVSKLPYNWFRHLHHHRGHHLGLQLLLDYSSDYFSYIWSLAYSNYAF